MIPWKVNNVQKVHSKENENNVKVLQNHFADQKSISYILLYVFQPEANIIKKS